MLNHIDWGPFILTAWVVLAFVLLCAIAVAGDLWAKASRPKRRRAAAAVVWHKGERVYLN